MAETGPPDNLVPIGRFAKLAGLTIPQQHRLRVERRLDEARAVLESIDRIISEGELMKHDGACSFCGKTPDQAPTRLTAGTARICAACVDLARGVLEIDARDPRPRPKPSEGQQASWLACSFCGRDKGAVRKLVAGPEYVAICDDCVAGAAAA